MSSSGDIFLSVCLPTYKRAAELEVCLSSLAEQEGVDWSSIEVVISDNASPPETSVVVERFRERFPHFVYFRWPENMGFDRNFLKAVEIASGGFCWFFSDDDAFEPGALAYVVGLTQRNRQVSGLIVGRNFYDVNLKILLQDGPSPDAVREVAIHGTDQILSGCVHDWGYIPSCIINREVWNKCAPSVPLKEAENYAQVWVMAEMAFAKAQWVVSDYPAIKYRTENDGFLAELGLTRRGAMLIESYANLSKWIKSRSYKGYRTVGDMACQGARHYILLAKKLGAEKGQQKNYWAVSRSLFRLSSRKEGWKFPRFYAEVLPSYLLPFWMVPCLKMAKAILRNGLAIIRNGRK